MAIDQGKARAAFVKHYKTAKKHFGLVLSKMLKTEFNVQGYSEERMDCLLVYSQHTDAPAKMWDETSEDQRHILVQSLTLAFEYLIIVKNDEKLELKKIIDEEISLSALEEDIPDDDQVVSDDEDDDDDKSLDPSVYDLDDEDAPTVLYHGTLEKNRDSIMEEGLQPRRLPHVTLKEDVMDAVNTAKRHLGDDEDEDDILILKIDAEAMVSDGIDVRSNDYGHGRVWEVDEVLPRYLKEYE